MDRVNGVGSRAGKTSEVKGLKEKQERLQFQGATNNQQQYQQSMLQLFNPVESLNKITASSIDTMS